MNRQLPKGRTGLFRTLRLDISGDEVAPIDHFVRSRSIGSEVRRSICILVLLGRRPMCDVATKKMRFSHQLQGEQMITEGRMVREDFQMKENEDEIGC